MSVTVIEICADCLAVLTKGPQDDYQKVTAELIHKRHNGDKVTLGGKFIGFSHCSCEGCGSPLGGDRYEAYLEK